MSEYNSRSTGGVQSVQLSGSILTEDGQRVKVDMGGAQISASIDNVGITGVQSSFGKLRVIQDNDYTLNIATGLTQWFTALNAALAATGQAKLVMFGDSIFEGFNASNFLTKSIAAIIRDNVANYVRQGVAADHIQMTWANKDAGNTPIWTKTGTAAYQSGTLAGGGKNSTYGWTRLNQNDTLVLPGANSGQIFGSFTTNFSNGFRVVFMKDPNGGRFKVTSSDGLDLGTIDTAGATRQAALWKNPTYQTSAVRDFTITALDAGKTVDIVAGNATHQSNDSKGVHLYNFARFGQIAVWGFDAFYNVVTPDLTIISSVANELSGPRSLGLFYNAVKDAVQKAQALGSSVLLVSNGYRYDTDAQFYVTDARRYENMHRKIALETGCAYVNINKMMGYDPTAVVGKFYATSDKVHPNDAGQAFVANAILDCILPS